MVSFFLPILVCEEPGVDPGSRSPAALRMVVFSRSLPTRGAARYSSTRWRRSCSLPPPYLSLASARTRVRATPRRSPCASPREPRWLVAAAPWPASGDGALPPKGAVEAPFTRAHPILPRRPRRSAQGEAAAAAAPPLPPPPPAEAGAAGVPPRGRAGHGRRRGIGPG